MIYDNPILLIHLALIIRYCHVRHIPTNTFVQAFTTACNGMKSGSKFTCDQSGDFLTYARGPETYRVNEDMAPLPLATQGPLSSSSSLSSSLIIIVILILIIIVILIPIVTIVIIIHIFIFVTVHIVHVYSIIGCTTWHCLRHLPENYRECLRLDSTPTRHGMSIAD